MDRELELTLLVPADVEDSPAGDAFIAVRSIAARSILMGAPKPPART